MGANKVRHVVGNYEYEDADLSKCKENDPYPDFNARFGYLHSFAMTQNYIILPETAYMHDPCYYGKVWLNIRCAKTFKMLIFVDLCYKYIWTYLNYLETFRQY